MEAGVLFTQGLALGTNPTANAAVAEAVPDLVHRIRKATQIENMGPARGKGMDLVVEGAAAEDRPGEEEEACPVPSPSAGWCRWICSPPASWTPS